MSGISHFAAAEEPPDISGSCGHPFPAILSLDYPVSRCRAWLKALENAWPYLPKNAVQTLPQLNLDARTGKDALCALLFPVDVVTPDISAAAEIKVYLKYSGDIAERAKKILDAPTRLVLTMCLIREMRQLLAEIVKAWPARIVPGGMDLPLLEKLTRRLAAFWLLVPGVEKDEDGALAANPDSLAALLFLAKKEYENGRFEKAGSLLTGLEGISAPQTMEDGANNALVAYGMLLRGEAQLRQGRFALAEMDFDAALEKLTLPVSVPDVARELFLNKALLARDKNNWTGMCGNLEKACGHGACEPLLQARLRGFCPRSID